MSEAPDPSAPAAPSGARHFAAGLARDWGVALAVVVAVFLMFNLLFPAKAPSLGPAADFTLDNLDGAAVTLSDLSHEHDLLVLNFWFTSCPPCRAEIPHLAAWADANPDVPLYGVSTDVNMSSQVLAGASKVLGINYPVLHDVRARAARSYGVDVFPTTLIIRDMEIVQSRVGAIDRTILEEMVDRVR